VFVVRWYCEHAFVPEEACSVAAVAYPLAQGPETGRPRLVVIGPGPADRQFGGRGAGGRPFAGSRQGARVYRRRRAVALALLVAGVVLAWLALRAVLAGPGGGPLTTTGSSSIGALRPGAVDVHVVKPGETVWSIVRSAGGSGDPRPEVDRLERQLHHRPLQVGQRLVLP
jgi:hypothetical protein